jgi:hypothetical protein
MIASGFNYKAIQQVLDLIQKLKAEISAKHREEHGKGRSIREFSWLIIWSKGNEMRIQLLEPPAKPNRTDVSEYTSSDALTFINLGSLVVDINNKIEELRKSRKAKRERSKKTKR